MIATLRSHMRFGGMNERLKKNDSPAISDRLGGNGPGSIARQPRNLIRVAARFQTDHRSDL